MSDFDAVLECPWCGKYTECNRWEDGVCQHCGGKFSHKHDCGYYPESGEEWCSDWLEKIQE